MREEGRWEGQRVYCGAMVETKQARRVEIPRLKVANEKMDD